MNFKSFYNSLKFYQNNDYNCIPLPFPKLRNFIPGTAKGTNIIVTANSGVGKTQFTKYLYVYHSFLWCRENKVPLKIMYFALEETKEEFIADATCFFLDHFYDIEIDSNKLLSMDSKVSNYILEKVESLSSLIDEFLESVDIQDDIANPTGILKYVENYAENNGTIYKKKIKIQNEERVVFDKYEPYKKSYVIVITDHIGLLQEENGETLHTTIRKFSGNYGRRKISKRYNYIMVLVQQQSASSESKQYNNEGELNLAKLEPTLSDLGDNKYTQRDALLVWGLFAPERYEIPMYRHWNIFKLQDNYRSIHVLKNRRGRSNIKSSMYFNGATNNFKELPKIERINGSRFIDKIPENKWYDKYFKNNRFWQHKLNFN